ncbi:disintegrin and metalloproteinase domain-containing protein 10-like protein, partial [Leptotrombidium deliense]
AENSLGNFISNYESLSYDSNLIHNRTKRHLHSETVDSLHIDFNAYGKQFNLRLTPDVNSVFSNNIIIENAFGERSEVDLTGVYTGFLNGHPHTSKVFGSVLDGVFEGKIETPNGTFYIDRANKYFNDDDSRGFHSVIYSSDDVDFEPSNDSGSSNIAKIQQWMNRLSTAAVIRKQMNNNKRRKRTLLSSHTSSQANSTNDKIVTTNIATLRKRVCSMYIQTDTYLWEHIRNSVSSDSKARKEIASLVAQHIKAVNNIYENVDFRGIRGIKFSVLRLKINDSSACSEINKTRNPFCSPNIDLYNFLELGSQFNHDDFCLAYIFTYRDFAAGKMGQSWTATTTGVSGGICEKYKIYAKKVNGSIIQTKLSLNTGVITFVNYNSTIPPKVSELVFANQIGHNLGSPNDYPLECRLGGSAGNFLMNSFASSGKRKNNYKLSPCSIRNISSVLHAVINSDGKHNCLQEDDGPFCGNNIVEEGEDCDCGFDAQECEDHCCNPRINAENVKGCTLRTGAQCATSQGACCSETCTFESKYRLCNPETECAFESF